MRRRAVALALLLPCLGCAALLDVERLRGSFVNERPPEPPVLSEAPPARLAAVEGLRTFSGELRSIPLRWDPVLAGDVGGYAIERSTASEGPFQRIAVLMGRFEISYLDRGKDLGSKVQARETSGDLGDGNTYYYRVRPFDSFGRLGAQVSAPQAGTTAATPAAPDGLRAWSQLPREVALSWEPLLDPTVSGYRVSRSPSASGTFRVIERLSGRFTTTYVDRGLGDLRVFYYRVAGLNAADGVGEATAAVRAVTKPEPLPPTGLHVAEQGLGRNVVAWERNVERDLAGYRVFRHRAGVSEGELVAEVNAETVRVADAEVGAGEEVAYSLIAFDRDGLVSESSDAVTTTSVAYGLVATVEGGSVVLRWDESLRREIPAVRVVTEGRFGPNELGRVNASQFLHRGVRPGQTVRYQLIGLRPDGSEAPPSAPYEVHIPD
jgi:fibronectin type 3 domain-containing protein